MRATAVLPALLLGVGLAWADKPVTITILHTNDMHAHIEPTSISKKPYGGYARQATLIKQFRKADPNVILLNAGDTFQGTMYFNMYEGLSDLAYMNAIGYQAMTLGNHEFDRGPSVLGTFAKSATFPIVSANLDFSAEPELRDLIKPYTVVGSGDAQLGVVGAVTPELPDISSPGPTVKLTDLVPSVQKAVDDLQKQGVHKVVLLSHIGYDEDLKLAPKLHGVALIVGGHSHTPLGTPNLPGWPKSEGPYPTKLKDSEGKEVLVVQAWEWGKVLGRLKLHFDSHGRIDKVIEAAPVVVDESVPEDVQVAELVKAFQKPIAAAMNQQVGEAAVALPNRSGGMADVVADAMLAATSKQGSVAAFVNAGGVRGGLEAGKVTFGMLSSIQPFRNTLSTLDLTGDELLRSLELGIGTGGMLLPSAGSSYEVDRSKPAGSRVSNVVIAGVPLGVAKTYRITFLSFTANGGDAHTVLKSAPGRRVDTGLIDIDALVDYVKSHSPLTASTTPRIVER